MFSYLLLCLNWTSSLENCFAERNLTLKITTDLIKKYQLYTPHTDEFIYAAADLFASSVYDCTFHEDEHAASQLNSVKEGDDQILEFWKIINIWMKTLFSQTVMRGRYLQVSVTYSIDI